HRGVEGVEAEIGDAFGNPDGHGLPLPSRGSGEDRLQIRHGGHAAAASHQQLGAGDTARRPGGEEERRVSDRRPAAAAGHGAGGVRAWVMCGPILPSTRWEAISPGCTVLTRILRLPSSMASPREDSFMNALVEE